jgi:uncharacterized protein YegL
VVPVYLVFEESTAVTPWLSELADSVRELCVALCRRPQGIRLSVLGFADDVAVHLDCVEPGDPEPLLRFDAHGRASYADLFTDLTARVAADADRLAAAGHAVHRPVVYLLTRGRPARADWRRAREQLTAPGGNGAGPARPAPEIVAYGIGPVHTAIITGLASRPELAFVARPNQDVAVSIRRFFAAVAGALARAGSPGDDWFVAVPDGFTPAALPSRR